MMTGKPVSLKIRLILFLLAAVVIYSGCKSNPTYSISFVTIREADFRTGPVKLPLSEKGKKTILAFLEKGGDRSSDNYIEPAAGQYYQGLFALLSDREFLYASKFRKEGKIDNISTALEKWFHKTIIYQLIDATREKPRTPNPMCITDGKYWWIFHMEKEKPADKDLKVMELLITSAPAKYLKHYGKIKEDKKEHEFTKYSCKDKRADEDQETSLPDLHDKLLERLNKVALIYLVARLQDKNLGFTGNDIRIIIPDVHMLSSEREKSSIYHSNYYRLLVKVVREFMNFKKEATAAGTKVTVYQLGDFFDLWRETPQDLKKRKAEHNLAAVVEKMAEDRIDLVKMIRSPELDTKFILGNHDFDIHFLENYVNSELYYYFPINEDVCPAAVMLHGDVFSMTQRHVPEVLQHYFLYKLTNRYPAHIKDLGKLRELVIDSHDNNTYDKYIRQPVPPHLGELKLVGNSSQIPAGNYNIKIVGETQNEKDLEHAKAAKQFVKMINDETGWDLRFAVIGHTHHARIVLDKIDEPEGFFALIDCGAWVEFCQGPGDETMPNAQIGVIYNNDARIYQLEPHTSGN